MAYREFAPRAAEGSGAASDAKVAVAAMPGRIAYAPRSTSAQFGL